MPAPATIETAEDAAVTAEFSHKLHDLRTPLHQIIGLSEMLIEVAEEDGHRDLLEGLNTIREAALELSALLREKLRPIQDESADPRCWLLRDAVRSGVSRVLGFPELMLNETPTRRLQPYLADLALIRQAGRTFLQLAQASHFSVVVDEGERPPEGASSSAVASVAAHLPGARILVVDDEAINREVLCRRLAREGCRATGVPSGSEALRMIRTEAFDAVLLDLQMPEMSGIEVLQRLKQDLHLRHLPVIMLSAHTEVERVARSIELGAEDYLPKPINSVLLRARLNACLEKKKMAEELLRAGKLQSIGVLAGGLAHGFNNTLTGVLGNLSLLSHRDDLPPGSRHLIQEAERSAVRAQELTRYLLTFAEGGAPVKQVLQPAALVQEVALPQVQGTAVNLQLLLPPGVWDVEADPHQLKQVIGNVVANALEAMPEGGELEIRVQNEETPPPAARPLDGQNFLVITVRDQGEGISPENLAHIFDPFFTTKEHARGLGLAAAYSIIQRHGGHIGIASELGKGTTVSIALPAVQPPEVAEPKSPASESAPALPAHPAHPAGDGAKRHRSRVLVMDDEEPIRDLAEIMLGVLGYSVVTVANGDDALAAHDAAMAAGEPFDIAVMDLTIPGGMGGAETIRRLRLCDKDIHAIVASGYSNDPVMSRPAEYGFNSVLPKPYVINDLIRILEQVAPREDHPE